MLNLFTFSDMHTSFMRQMMPRSPTSTRFKILMVLYGLGLTACQASSLNPGTGLTGVSMTGIDHLADHLSVQDYQVDGHSGFQAGKGGRVVCCAKVPAKWQRGFKVHVAWNVTNWKERTSQEHEADVEVEPYEELGAMHVHFLADGQVKVLLSNPVPWAKDYPGPRGIPQKRPWDQYPWPSALDEVVKPAPAPAAR